MKKNKNAGQKWSSDDRTSTSAWERALRPHGSSLWLLVFLSIAACVFLALAFWTAIQDARAPAQSRTGTEANAVAPDQALANSVAPVRPGPDETVSSGAAPSLPEPGSRQIYKCTSRAGAASYSDGPCPAGTFTSVVTVRPETNVVGGMTREARQASIDGNATAARDALPRERQVASNDRNPGGPVAAECARLSNSIDRIDAAARQPRPADEQDRLKAERMRLRDRHFVLRCT